MNCDRISPDPRYQTRDEKLILLERRVAELERKVAELCESIKKIEGQ